eukprot:s5135_g2.t1
MPVDDEDMPPPTSQQPEPDLDYDPIELHNGGDPPSQPPGGGAQVPVPESAQTCRWIRMAMVAINHQEAVHRDRDLAMVRHRTSRPCLWSIMTSHLLLEVLLVLLVRFLSLLIRIKCLVHLCRDFPVPSEPASSSSDPVAVPGLPVTEGEFLIHQTPLPEPTPEPSVPETGEDSDSDATVDYRDSSLLALANGDDDILTRLPADFQVPSFVPLDGDGFTSWLTKQDKIKAGALTLEMQRKYAKEIRAAKLEVFKSTWTMMLSGSLTVASLVRMSIFSPAVGS